MTTKIVGKLILSGFCLLAILLTLPNIASAKLLTFVWSGETAQQVSFTAVCATSDNINDPCLAPDNTTYVSDLGFWQVDFATATSPTGINSDITFRHFTDHNGGATLPGTPVTFMNVDASISGSDITISNSGGGGESHPDFSSMDVDIFSFTYEFATPAAGIVQTAFIGTMKHNLDGAAGCVGDPGEPFCPVPEMPTGFGLVVLGILGISAFRILRKA